MSRASDLTGTVALVTGASSGIGEATACALHAAGATVALLARSPSALEEISERLGDRALPFEADVTDEVVVEHAVDRIEDELGPLRVAVNSAGVCIPCPVAELDADEWHRTLDPNLSGTYYVARHTGLRMVASGGGTIVNIGSEMGRMGAAGYVAYATSKAGVEGLTRALAAEFAPTVTVNTVAPGPVDTPMLHAELELTGDAAAAMRDEVARVPLKRVAAARDVAAAVLFLVTDGGFATGSTLALDGGTTIT